MNTSNLLKATSCLLMTTVFNACSNDAITTDLEDSTSNSMLIVKAARNLESSEVDNKISYPINVYVMKSTKCVANQVLNDKDASLQFSVPSGNYQVYAIAGASDTKYELPTFSTATSTSIVKLKDGMSHDDLMAANADLCVADQEVNTLTLGLKRKVLLLQNVTMSNIPTNIKGVSITLMPIYSNLLLNGNYTKDTEDAQSSTINLVQQEDKQNWKLVDGKDLLPASGKATIKISLTNEDNSVTSFSYQTKDSESFDANYKINITGTYKNKEISIQGTITGPTWGGEKNIAFVLDESTGTTTESDNNENGENEPSTPNNTIDDVAPQENTIYKGAYVVSSSKESNGNTTVTLMSTTSSRALKFNPLTQENIKNVIEKKLKELPSIDGGSWRLPSLDEIKKAIADRDKINAVLEANGVQTLVTGTTSTSAVKYYYLEEDGMISVLSAYNLTSYDVASEKTALHLRGFITVTFTK